MIEGTANPVRDSVWRWRVSIFMERDSEVSLLPKDAERRLDRANGKSCRRQCLAIASEQLSIFMERDSEVA